MVVRRCASWCEFREGGRRNVGCCCHLDDVCHSVLRFVLFSDIPGVCTNPLLFFEQIIWQSVVSFLTHEVVIKVEIMQFLMSFRLIRGNAGRPCMVERHHRQPSFHGAEVRGSGCREGRHGDLVGARRFVRERLDANFEEVNCPWCGWCCFYKPD